MVQNRHVQNVCSVTVGILRVNHYVANVVKYKLTTTQ